jgi:spermidine synthase
MAGCLTLSAAAAAVAVGQVDAASLRMARMAGDPGTTFAAVMVHQWVTALALLGPVAFGFGAIFPFALRAAREESAAGPAFLYGVNSAGAVAGALGAGFFLVPRVGLLGTVRVAVGACAAAAIAIALRGMPSVGGRLAVAAMSAAAVVATATSQWDYRLLSSGAYKYAAQAAGGDVEVLFAAGRLRLYREGAAATVAVRDVAGVRSLSIDGKVDASNGGDMLTQRLLAHVPLLLHPAPRAVGIVGLGSGVTLGSALAHAPKRVDVFEISPEVVEAARLFEAEHGGALDHPAVRIVVGDARTHFALTRAGYDVIISEPSNPWMAGVAALFTQEFFLKLRDSLAAGGIVCQWAHTYDMSAANLRSIVATFHSVFPRLIVWSVGDGDLLLVGLTEDATGPGFSRMASGFDRPGVPVDLASVGVTGPAVLASLVLAGPDDVARFAAGAEIQRDDRMALEFSAPSAMAGRPREDAPGALRAAFPDRARPAEARAMAAAGGPRARRDTALMLMRADAMESAWSVLVPALEGLPGDRDALAALTRIGAATGRLAEVERLLVDLARRAPGEIAARLELSRWLAAAGRGAEALAVARDAEAIAPSSAAAAAQVAAVAADLQDLAILRPAAARLRALAPDSADTAYYSGIALLIDSRATEAAAEAARAAARQPGHARAWNLLGAALGAAGGPVERIREAFERAIVADPRDPAAYVNLAALDLRAGRPAEAAARFAEALMIDPSNAAARDGFRTARARLD